MHCGHVRMIRDAAVFGKVIIILNSDNWLTRKKGKPFMKFEGRKEVLESLLYVDYVVEALDDDGTVCDSLREYKNIIKWFGNGGDRQKSNTPELQLCVDLGIIPIFGLGGNKIQSSSKLMADFMGTEC